VFITIGPYQATGSSSGFSRHEEEPDPVLPGLNRDFVAACDERGHFLIYETNLPHMNCEVLEVLPKPARGTSKFSTSHRYSPSSGPPR
jgi:hypothetical protein